MDKGEKMSNLRSLRQSMETDRMTNYRLSTRLLPATALALSLSALPVLAADGDAAKVPENDLLNATLWMSNSVEYDATVEGIFALAKMRLDEALKDNKWTALPDMQGDGYEDQPVAIIADLDETFFDNSPYEASLIKRGTSYSSKEWNKYVDSRVTKAVPGAVEFAKYADSKGVKVFYISNRSAEVEESTRADLEKLGFPMGGNVDTVLAKGEKEDWGSKKESRDKVVAKDYRVVMMLGDNLGDFTDKADGTPEERQAFVKEAADHWGHDWIMLPNPEYGSWESAAFGGDWKKSADERRQMKIDALEAWEPKSE